MYFPVALIITMKGGEFMRYFSDEQINQMKERVRNDFSPKSRAIYMMYVSRIEELNKKYDEGKVESSELLQAISELQRFSDSYVPHNNVVDKNDEDADAYEYENYDFSIKNHL